MLIVKVRFTVVLGSRILMMTAANRFGLYSALRACSAIFFRSSLHPRLTVDTIFWEKNRFLLFDKCIEITGQV